MVSSKALSCFAILNCALAASDPVIEAVSSQMTKLAKSSWEFGTVSQALIELQNPSLSVFGSRALFPLPSKLDTATIPGLAYAKQHIQLDNGATLVPDPASSADPASLGVAAVMLGAAGEKGYRQAVERQSQTLLSNTPRWENGAISHRIKEKALWSDFVYMAPPFLAFYAASSNNEALLRQSVEQCKLYGDVLKSRQGGWMHIASKSQSHSDTGLWSTGNGWAAMGMARVLATVRKATGIDPRVRTSLENTLVGLIKGILGAAKGDPRGKGGLLHNYLTDSSSLAETSGTALLAAVAYRMAVLSPSVFGGDYIAWADASRAAMLSHINRNGIVSPAVNPYNYRSEDPYTVGSPEGQAFVLMMYAAHRDYLESKRH